MTVKMQVRRYGKYVFPFFLMLVAASFGYNTLRIVLTSRCQRSQCCGYFFIQFFIAHIAAVQLMEHFSVLDEQNSVCRTRCLHTVRHHQDGLSLLIDLLKQAKQFICSPRIQRSCRYCIVSKNDSFVQFAFCKVQIAPRSEPEKSKTAQKKRAEQGTAPCPVLFYFLILFLQITL